MIRFKLKSTDNSKKSYSFSTLGLYGTLVIDTETHDIEITEVFGEYADSEKQKERLLYIAKDKIVSSNFATECMYATH